MNILQKDRIFSITQMFIDSKNTLADPNLRIQQFFN